MLPEQRARHAAMTRHVCSEVCCPSHAAPPEASLTKDFYKTHFEDYFKCLKSHFPTCPVSGAVRTDASGLDITRLIDYWCVELSYTLRSILTRQRVMTDVGRVSLGEQQSVGFQLASACRPGLSATPDAPSERSWVSAWFVRQTGVRAAR